MSLLRSFEEILTELVGLLTSSHLISFHSVCVEVDMWSFGVICYIVLCGCPPFLDDDLSGLLDKIVEGHLTFEEEHWKEVSIEAIDFCRKMLCVDQCDRFVLC